jgi:hypothetical protein
VVSFLPLLMPLKSLCMYIRTVILCDNWYNKTWIVFVFLMPVAPAINPCLLSVLVVLYTLYIASSSSSMAFQKNTYCFRDTALSNLFCEIFGSWHGDCKIYKQSGVIVWKGWIVRFTAILSLLLLIVEKLIYEIKFIYWYIILIFHKR